MDRSERCKDREGKRCKIGKQRGRAFKGEGKTDMQAGGKECRWRRRKRRRKRQAE